jgi:RsiW-degrading membrane proteinase PrsW (M82 family)
MLPQKRTSLADLLLSIWWVRWFGIIGGFLYVGVSQVRFEFSRCAVSRPSLALIVAVPLLWICFFIADFKANERTHKVVKLLTIAGTLLAAFSVLGICFFVANAAGGR